MLVTLRMLKYITRTRGALQIIHAYTCKPVQCIPTCAVKYVTYHVSIAYHGL